MASSTQKKAKRVLIASSHALFARGLSSLLQTRQQRDVEVVGVVSSVEQAILQIEKLSPDLIVVDYDDESLNRDEFLARFVEGEKKLRVVLLSLHDGEQALVYDRRTLAAAQVDDWLEEWSRSRQDFDAIVQPEQGISKKVNRSDNMRHYITAGILVAVVTALLIVGLGQVRLLPVAASAQALPLDFLFNLQFQIIAFLFALIVVAMLYSIIVFRRKPGDTTDARHIEGNTNLEVAWTIVPLFVVMGLAVLGSDGLAKTTRAEPRALEVNVIGQQWAWRFEYPELGIVTDVMRLPVNKQALLHLSSIDVIHSFWVPEFRVKQDALPGGEEFVRDLRVTPSMTGNFKVRCAELCGLRHAYMENDVIVMTQEEFDAWVAEEQGLAADPVERGRKWYTTYGCNACHSLDGAAGVGPTWQGIYGTQGNMADGTSVVKDDTYLYESIRNPASQLVDGYNNLMPANIAEQMTDQQVEDVIRLIESLK
jgi:cytochrome c oxidase subunit 2